MLVRARGRAAPPSASLEARAAWAAERGIPALDAWTNVRWFRLDGGWLLMDTVGNGQRDVPDLEAVFPASFAECGAVGGLLRRATGYLVERGRIIEDGNTMDGPGGAAFR